MDVQLTKLQQLFDSTIVALDQNLWNVPDIYKDIYKLRFGQCTSLCDVSVYLVWEPEES